MSQNSENRPPPELVREYGEVQIFRWPDTGEEFATTISKQISVDQDDLQQVTLRYEPPLGASAKEAFLLITVLKDVIVLNRKDVLRHIKIGQAIDANDVPLWKAKQAVSKAAKDGLVLQIFMTKRS